MSSIQVEKHWGAFLVRASRFGSSQEQRWWFDVTDEGRLVAAENIEVVGDGRVSHEDVLVPERVLDALRTSDEVPETEVVDLDAETIVDLSDG